MRLAAGGLVFLQIDRVRGRAEPKKPAQFSTDGEEGASQDGAAYL